MIEKEFEYKGMKCTVKVMDGIGHRCGYVRIDDAHPLFGCDDKYIWGWDDEDNRFFDLTDEKQQLLQKAAQNISVHGGITYAEPAGEGYWEFGFDCAHFGDKPDPQYTSSDYIFNREGHMWTLEEVEAETKAMADQLNDIAVVFG